MRVKLSHYPHASHLLGGVKTEVDGLELPEVGHINLDCPVDGLPRLRVEMLPREVDIELNAEVSVDFIVLDGFDVEYFDTPDGKHHVRATRRSALD